MMVTGSVMKYLPVGPLLGSDISPVIMASSPPVANIRWARGKKKKEKVSFGRL